MDKSELDESRVGRKQGWTKTGWTKTGWTKMNWTKSGSTIIPIDLEPNVIPFVFEIDRKIDYKTAIIFHLITKKYMSRNSTTF